MGARQDSTDVPFHPKYEGTVLFKNKFNGQLPATDYPKVNFYLAMLLVYVLFASAWGWLCYQHVQDLLPIQVRGPVAVQNPFLTWAPVLSVWACRFLGGGDDCQLEYVLNQFGLDSGLNDPPAYYRYLNAHGKGTASTVFLIVGKMSTPFWC